MGSFIAVFQSVLLLAHFFLYEDVDISQPQKLSLGRSGANWVSDFCR